MGSAGNDSAAGIEWRLLQNPLALRIAAGSMTFWAGTINGLATVALVFGRVSHMSGRIIDQAPTLFYNPPRSLFVSTLLLGFFIGTMMGAVALPRLKLTGALTVAMLPIIVAVILVSMGVYGTSADSYAPARFMLAFLLPLGMGMQNSITSQTCIGRTTHMTGDMTDLGISVVKGNWERVRYLGLKYVAFCCGGLAGYLGSRMSPVLTLLLGVAGIIITAYCLQHWDRCAQRCTPTPF